MKPPGEIKPVDPMLTDIEKKVIAALQDDIPICERPYREMAGRLGITEAAFLATVEGLRDRGIIRRFGATLRHQKSGFTANAMGAWVVDEDRVEEVGRRFAGFKEVSHCYRRDPTPEWPYNLYTMIHAPDEASCRETARRMARTAAIERYTLLFSKTELKKTSMTYFSDDEDD